ncbi:MAG: amino acid permease [Oscillospiraceae bacterium]|jgi:L-asparagine transporter-like permease
MDKRENGLGALQLTMMALGTVIGGSFFLGSAVAVRAAGPSVIIGFILGGVLVYFILFAISEMTVANPDCGSFRTFASQAFGEAAGFIVGWVYWTGMVLAMSSEATAVSILLRQWFPGISVPLTGASIIVGITLLNLLGADKISKLESVLAAVKLFAIVFFIIIALLIIFGLLRGARAAGLGELNNEPFMPGGVSGLAGSMLLVMFTYAGFEIIGFAASEARDPEVTVPKAIRYTVLGLSSLYIAYTVVLLTLIPTSELNENVSPIVAAMNRHGITWAGTALNIVLISAILSTMLAAMFGLGRMMRSIAREGQAPRWLKDKGEVPYRGILASGSGMLFSLGTGLMFPSVYLFLISSGGFALLFSYVMIMATHIRFRKKYGCPPDGKCQLWGYPYTSLIVLLALVSALASMPFVPGQTSGLAAGITIVIFYSACYCALRVIRSRKKQRGRFIGGGMAAEMSEELTDFNREEEDGK